MNAGRDDFELLQELFGSIGRWADAYPVSVRAMDAHDFRAAIRERLRSIARSALEVREADSDISRERALVQIEAAAQDIDRLLLDLTLTP